MIVILSLILSFQMMDLKLTVDGLEKERDFYFGKLRDIEVLCQENEGEAPVIQNILNILYATEVSPRTPSLYINVVIRVQGV